MERVAAYCRVSTDKDDQVNSLESQKRYFDQYIRLNPHWELTEIYVDEGTSGTNTKKRRAFNRMISDAQQGRFDLLLTKEISRFARNTLDSIYYTRRLKEWGVGVVFLSDNINTLDPDAELRLTIMSSIAQEESRRTSDRVKWGQKRRMEQGVVFGRSLLGYDVREGQLFLNEEGAKIVRLIYHKFVVEEKGTYVIARELREAGIPTYHRTACWSNTVILRALRNEKYCGDLVQKKTWTPDYLTHEKKRNRGEEELVVLRDHHPPIIDRTLWEQAQAELVRRSPTQEQRSRHSSRYCFSGKLRCGACGAPYVSRTKKRKDGSIYRAWRCQQAVAHGRPHIDDAGHPVGCDNKQVGHQQLLSIMGQVVGRLPLDREAVISDLLEVIAAGLTPPPSGQSVSRIRARIQTLEGKRQRLIDVWLGQEIDQRDYQSLWNKYEQERSALEAELLRHGQPAHELTLDETLDDLAASLGQMLTGEVPDEGLVRGLLDHMVIYSPHQLEVSLKLFPYPLAVTVDGATPPPVHRPPAEGSGVPSETDLPISVSRPCTRA